MTSVSRSSSLVVALLLFSTVSLAEDIDAVLHKANALKAEKKFASAAALLDPESPQDDPARLLAFTRLLVDNYLATINFELFATRDLAPGETVAEVRGEPGEYQFFGGSLEELLFNAYKANPESAEINQAVGYYLSKQQECGCGAPRLFVGTKADSAQYFRKAEAAGLVDAWSLFRLGVASQSTTEPDLEAAAQYYRRAITLDASLVPAHFNLAGILLWRGELKEAREQAEAALDGYENAAQNADSHTLLGSILEADGKTGEAEAHYRKALEIQEWNARAFLALAQLLHDSKRYEEYADAVVNYIAIELSNSYLFNAYIDRIAQHGISDADRAIEQRLLKLELDNAQTGAVYFNLGRFAEHAGDPALALQRYETALAAFQKIAEPPKGAIPALENRIQHLKTAQFPEPPK